MSVDLKTHTFIRASRADVWAALTDAASVAAFHPTGMQVRPLETGGYPGDKAVPIWDDARTLALTDTIDDPSSE